MGSQLTLDTLGGCRMQTTAFAMVLTTAVARAKLLIESALSGSADMRLPRRPNLKYLAPDSDALITRVRRFHA
jgi:hypothetical protein